MAIIYIDIDDTICETEGIDYKNAIPIKKNIDKINQLCDNGNTIVYWTSRGKGSGKNFRELTKRQLKKWGVRYTKLKFGKPIFNLFIDDKAINSLNYFKETK